MSALQAITQNKTKLQAILTADYSLILNKVHENQLVTSREYGNLKEIARLDVEGHVIKLVDKLFGKGESHCHRFLQLLQTDGDILDTFPNLTTIAWHPSLVNSCLDRPPCVSNETSNLTPCKDVPVQETQSGVKEVDHYKINSGLCLIINNESFSSENGSPLKKRRGTDKDAEDLARVFHKLHFKVVMCKDQTQHKLEDILKLFSSLTDKGVEEVRRCGTKEWSGSSSDFTELKTGPQHGDAFVCCILSHGAKGSVHGARGESLPIEKITSTFNGGNCRALIDKPKVFFIQACQGALRQRGVVADDASLEADVQQMVFTPEEADFLVAISTVQNYVSFRDPSKGSWFIQSLCNQLDVDCPRGDDIVTILTRVNEKVSQMLFSDNPDKNKNNTQMPEVRFTLRKKLVFPF